MKPLAVASSIPFTELTMSDKTIEQRITEIIVDQLGVNYRSTEQVVDAFTAVAPNMGASCGMLPLALQADRGAGPGVAGVRGRRS